MMNNRLRTNEMSPASLEGKNLGKYRVLEPLGRGGMAQVYRAYHPQLDRYLAIKVLRSDLVEETEFLARFQREARSVASLRHPNIVQIYDFDVQDDYYYMVIELLEGDTLKARLNSCRTRGETMPLGEAARILLDVLNGLGYAHSEGIIHRDIKPANIMLNRRGQAIITDFGIAQIIGGTQYTLTGALMGTLNYMAPEQGLENRCDARSDLYSLGIVFYEMVTGRPPFDADTPLAILMKHLNDPLPLPRQINPQLPESFERVLLKALAKNPDDRYQSAGEMAKALQDALTEASVTLAEPPLESTRPAVGVQPDGSVALDGSVAVFSGTSKHAITDPSFAADDTDAHLSQHLAAEAPTQPPQSFVQSVAAALKQPVVDGNVPGSVTTAFPGGVTTAALAFGLSLVVTNLLVVSIGVATRNWGAYGYGWPFELCLVSMGLGLLMAALSAIWFFIPAGLLLGNGLLLAFYSLTGAWSYWAFLWPLEPVLVFAVIWLAIRWARQPESARRLAQRLGIIMAGASFVTGFLTIGIAYIVKIIH
jgi:serine/threonine protein kinase